MSTRPCAATGKKTVPGPLPVLAPTELPERDEDARWLVEGLWPAGGVGIIGGQAKSWKTFLALDLAISVASGTPCISAFPTRKGGKVLVYAAEDGLPDIRARLAGICAGRGVRLYDLDLGIIAVTRLHLDQERDKKRLEATLTLHKPALLILDPFVRLHTAIDENSAGDVSAILGELRRLQRLHGVAIALVHHARKNGNAMRPGQALRGSSDFHAWGDCNLYLQRKDDFAMLTVEHRAAPSPKPLKLELSAPGSGTGPSLRVIEGGETFPEAPSATTSTCGSTLAERIVRLLQDTAAPLSQAKLRRHVQARNETVGNVLRELEGRGRILRTAKGWVAQTGQQLQLPLAGC